MGEVRRRGKVWWIRVYRNGQRHEESSKSERKQTAVDLLRLREGNLARGVPVSAKVGRVLFDAAANDLLNDYIVNNRKSLNVVERRVKKHLLPYFGGRRLASITTADVRAYVKHRQEQGIANRNGDRTGDVSNAEINRELQQLKRLFSLAVQSDKVFRKPHIPMLEESAPRAGFFEREQFEAVRRHLPPPSSR